MRSAATNVVDLIRDFVEAHRRLEAAAARHRRGELEFAEVQALVGEAEGTVLHRLKERCHALYRQSEGSDGELGAGAMFDLAIGSLFHEAMKFREGFYQLSAYGPKLEVLRQSREGSAQALLAEFEKILAETRLRIEDSLAETEALLGWTTGQLEALLHSHRDEGPLARFLVERGDDVAGLIGREPADLLTALYGSPHAAHVIAARSYLASGFYREACHVLRGVDGDDAVLLTHFAEGMTAYLEGRYPDCVSRLTDWLDGGATDAGFGRAASAALERIGQLIDDDGGLPEAKQLADRIRSGVAA